MERMVAFVCAASAKPNNRTYTGLRITGRRHKILGAASNEKQTAALRSIHDCADTSMLQNQDKPPIRGCGLVDKR